VAVVGEAAALPPVVAGALVLVEVGLGWPWVAILELPSK
jgi:hypothetical protein